MSKFNLLVQEQFLYGGKKYAMTNTKESTDVLFDRYSDLWLYGTMDKYCQRFRNLERERDLLKIACYCKDTEILTEEGWILIKDMVEKKLKIKVATYNQDRNKVEYHYPLKYIKQEREEDLFVQHNKFFDLKVTKDHNLFVKSPGQDKFSLVRADKSNKILYYKRDFSYINNKDIESFRLPKYENINYERDYKVVRTKDEKIIEMDDWLRFFGMWLAEGCLGSSSVTVLTQSSEINPDKCALIEGFLDRLNFKYSIKSYRAGMNTYYIYDNQLHVYLKTFGKSTDKYIPRDLLKNLSVRQLNILLDYMCLGDGHKRGEDSYLYATASKKLADDFQELALKSGYTANITGKRTEAHSTYTISISKKYMESMVNSGEDLRSYEPYKGSVYCLTVPNSTLFTRLNGKTVWCGNCYCYILWLKRGFWGSEVGKVHDTSVYLKEAHFEKFITKANDGFIVGNFKITIDSISELVYDMADKRFNGITETDIFEIYSACRCLWEEKYLEAVTHDTDTHEDNK